jgi:hypothetical protein
LLTVLARSAPVPVHSVGRFTVPVHSPKEELRLGKTSARPLGGSAGVAAPFSLLRPAANANFQAYNIRPKKKKSSVTKSVTEDSVACLAGFLIAERATLRR